jgi:TPR repeat protein
MSNAGESRLRHKFQFKTVKAAKQAQTNVQSRSMYRKGAEEFARSKSIAIVSEWKTNLESSSGITSRLPTDDALQTSANVNAHQCQAVPRGHIYNEVVVYPTATLMRPINEAPGDGVRIISALPASPPKAELNEGIEDTPELQLQGSNQPEACQLFDPKGLTNRKFMATVSGAFRHVETISSVTSTETQSQEGASKVVVLQTIEPPISKTGPRIATAESDDNKSALSYVGSSVVSAIEPAISDTVPNANTETNGKSVQFCIGSSVANESLPQIDESTCSTTSYQQKGGPLSKSRRTRSINNMKVQDKVRWSWRKLFSKNGGKEKPIPIETLNSTSTLRNESQTHIDAQKMTTNNNSVTNNFTTNLQRLQIRREASSQSLSKFSSTSTICVNHSVSDGYTAMNRSRSRLSTSSSWLSFDRSRLSTSSSRISLESMASAWSGSSVASLTSDFTFEKVADSAANELIDVIQSAKERANQWDYEAVLKSSKHVFDNVCNVSSGLQASISQSMFKIVKYSAKVDIACSCLVATIMAGGIPKVKLDKFTPSPRKAIKYLLRGERKSHVECIYNAATIMEKAKSDHAALLFYVRASKMYFLIYSRGTGHPAAMLRLGFAYMQGDFGLSRELNQAVSWIRRSSNNATKEYSQGKYEYARLHENGLYPALMKDHRYMMSLLQEGCNLDNASCHLKVASGYEDGSWGLIQSLREAYRHYHLAATLENTEVCALNPGDVSHILI